MKLQLYRAYVKPILSYACPVWINAPTWTLIQLRTVKFKVPRTVLDVRKLRLSINEINDMAKINKQGHTMTYQTPNKIKYKLVYQILIDNEVITKISHST